MLKKSMKLDVSSRPPSLSKIKEEELESVPDGICSYCGYNHMYEPVEAIQYHKEHLAKNASQYGSSDYILEEIVENIQKIRAALEDGDVSNNVFVDIFKESSSFLNTTKKILNKLNLIETEEVIELEECDCGQDPTCEVCHGQGYKHNISFEPK